MRSTLLLLLVVFCCIGLQRCSNIEDAELASRSTFVKFYEGADGKLGVRAIPVADGYVLLANSSDENNLVGYVIKTDEKGNTQWSTQIDGTFRSIAVGPDGYYMAGDSIKVDPNAEQVPDLLVTSAVVYRLNLTGDVVDKYTIKADTIQKIDFRANALTFNEQGHLIMLGTYNSPNIDQEPYLVAFNTAFDTLWTKRYDVIARDYINTKSMHATGDGHLIWATALAKEQGSFSRSFMMVPYVLEQSVFENADVYGETTDQQLSIMDIQPAASPEFGYAVIGSYATPSGENSNLFFSRVTKSGTIVDGSAMFYDGASEGVSTDKDQSVSEDRGSALCATNDGGFVLAGTRETQPGIGNGGDDLLLIKVDSQGNVIWRKTYGGSNSERVGSIVETADGGLLVCGSVDATGLPALMLIKTDGNGDIKD